MFTAVVWRSESRSQLTEAYHAAAPREFVAVLGGRIAAQTAHVEQIVMMPNVAVADDAFEVDAVTFAQHEHTLREASRRVLGFAHSHVDGHASPSARDRRQLWTNCLQVIVSKEQCRAFVLDQQRNVLIVRDASPAPEVCR